MKSIDYRIQSIERNIAYHTGKIENQLAVIAKLKDELQCLKTTTGRSVDILDIDNRTLNILKKEGITTLQQARLFIEHREGWFLGEIGETRREMIRVALQKLSHKAKAP